MYAVELAKESNLILLREIQLIGPQGTTKVDFLLDTGAAYSMISWNTALELGYDLESARSIPIVTGNGTVTTPVINLKGITIGNITVKNVAGICHDIPSMIEATGLLGLNFLKHLRTVIDYRALRLTME